MAAAAAAAAAPAAGEKVPSVATFAAGCFWSVELVFQREPGVLKTQVGYTGGNTENPSYKLVCSGLSGHAEAVRLEYDSSQVSYDRLLEIFFKKHDPTQMNRQGNDVGTQYRSAIFYHNEEQKVAAAAAIAAQEKARGGGTKLATELTEASTWYPAEEYHQQYLEKGGQSAAKGETAYIRCYG